MQSLIPLIFIVIIVYFLAVRPIKKRMTSTGKSAIRSIPIWAYFVAGIILIGYGVGWNVAAESSSQRLRSTMSNSEEAALVYLSYIAGALGLISVSIGFFVGLTEEKDN